jgi:hypothetical protein
MVRQVPGFAFDSLLLSVIGECTPIDYYLGNNPPQHFAMLLDQGVGFLAHLAKFSPQAALVTVAR